MSAGNNRFYRVDAARAWLKANPEGLLPAVPAVQVAFGIQD
ncbi:MULTISPECIES: hypothetical protein [Paracoccus]|nr:MULTISPECIES: hypothetical protein [Paracoccus]